MRLVEAVFGEFFHQVENFVGLVLVDVVFFRAGNKVDAFLGHGLGFLFTHGAAQQVGPAQRVAGDDLGDLHDLFLIDNNAVGIAQAVCKRIVRIYNGHLPVLALDKFVHHARTQRAGAVQGQHGDDVFKARGLEHAQVLPHARTFYLKDAVRIATGVQLVGFGIGKRQVVEVWRLVALKADVVERILNQGHGFQTQKVELDQPCFFGHGAVKLGHKFAAFALIQGQVFLHGLV